jgi:hypothetical protein
VARLDLVGEEGGEPGDAGVGERSRRRAAPVGGPAELLAQLNEVRSDGVDQVEAGRQQRLQAGSGTGGVLFSPARWCPATVLAGVPFQEVNPGW